MARVEKTALVPYSAQAMFELVADVERYKEFLPWCSNSRLISRTEDEICGWIEVARLGVRQAFSTCNDIDPPHHMQIALRDGPFQHLHGDWHFQELREDACKVMLRMDFEFSGGLIDVAFGKVFNQAANSMVASFVKRAGDIYGG